MVHILGQGTYVRLGQLHSDDNHYDNHGDDNHYDKHGDDNHYDNHENSRNHN